MVFENFFLFLFFLSKQYAELLKTSAFSLVFSSRFSVYIFFEKNKNIVRKELTKKNENDIIPLNRHIRAFLRRMQRAIITYKGFLQGGCRAEYEK